MGCKAAPGRGAKNSPAARANIAAPLEPNTKLEAVGSFPQGNTPEGIADLVGNVAEWTRSQFLCSRDDCPWDPAQETGDALSVRGSTWRNEVRRITAPVLSVPAFAEPEFGFSCVQN